MGRPKHPGGRAPKSREKRKKARAKMRMLSMSIDIPAELDLPAGAPFEGREIPATMKMPQDIGELRDPLVEMATNAWRLKLRMVDPDTGEPKEETRKLYRFVEGLFRALEDAGIQVIDKTGKRYDEGMSENPVSFDQVPGLLKAEVIETVRPSIRWKEQLIYCGEIIVGIPVIETPAEEVPKAEAAAIAPETDPVATLPVKTSEPPLAQTEGAPDSHENEPPELPESDAVVTDRQNPAAQTDSALDQPEPVIPEDPPRPEADGQDSMGGSAEEASAPADLEDRQEQGRLVDSGASAQPATLEQPKERDHE